MADLGDAWLWIAPAVGFLVHLTVGRQNAQRVAEQWESLPRALDPEGLGRIRSAVEVDSETLEIALDAARQAHAEGDGEEANRQLSLAHEIVDDAIPDRLRRLDALALVARMAGALEPLPALTPAAYQSWRLRALAGLAYGLHEFLFGTGARLTLRMHVISASLSIVRRLLERCRRTLLHRPSDQRALRQFEACADDFRALDRQHLEAAGACLVSSRIQPRLQILTQRTR